MNLKLLSIIPLVVILTACSPKTVYVDRPVEVKVPVKCKVELPDGGVNESLNESQKYVEILKYISTLHKNIQRCE